jgi:hypothetical protein
MPAIEVDYSWPYGGPRARGVSLLYADRSTPGSKLERARLFWAPHSRLCDRVSRSVRSATGDTYIWAVGPDGSAHHPGLHRPPRSLKSPPIPPHCPLELPALSASRRAARQNTGFARAARAAEPGRASVPERRHRPAQRWRVARADAPAARRPATPPPRPSRQLRYLARARQGPLVPNRADQEPL